MHYTILEFRYENEQPAVVYETDCDSSVECIDEFITMITDLFDANTLDANDEHINKVIDKLQADEYTIESLGILEDVIKVYTY